MKADWIPCDKFTPDRDGTYLVTTVNGAIRIDRFVDGEWGLCMARHNNRGRYRPHRAWAYLPKPFSE